MGYRTEVQRGVWHWIPSTGTAQTDQRRFRALEVLIRPVWSPTVCSFWALWQWDDETRAAVLFLVSKTWLLSGTVLCSSMGSARCLFPSGATCGSHGARRGAALPSSCSGSRLAHRCIQVEQKRFLLMRLWFAGKWRASTHRETFKRRSVCCWVWCVRHERRYVVGTLNHVNIWWKSLVFYSQENDQQEAIPAATASQTEEDFQNTLFSSCACERDTFFRSIFTTNGASIWSSAHCFLAFCSLSHRTISHTLSGWSHAQIWPDFLFLSQRLEIFTVLATIINACSEEIQSHLQ